jgi:hypothetical protein
MFSQNCNVQWREAILAPLANVGTELSVEAFHHFRITLLGCDKQGRVTTRIGLVDVSSKLLNQASDRTNHVVQNRFT